MNNKIIYGSIVKFRAVFVVINVLLLFGFSEQIKANPCLELDMTSPEAIVACVLHEEKKGETAFRVFDKCTANQQHIKRKVYIAVNGRLPRSRLPKDTEVPTCKTIASVISMLWKQPPPWADCVDYDGSEAHFRKCVIGYMKHGYRISDHTARTRLARMDARGLTRHYTSALSHVYGIHRLKDGRTYRLPPNYVAPSTDTVNAYLSELKADINARRQRQAEEQLAAAEAKKKQRLAVSEAKKKRKQEQIERARKKQEQHIARKRNEERAFIVKNQELLVSRRATTHPVGKLDDSIIRETLIEEMHAAYPPKENVVLSPLLGLRGSVIHTINGVRVVVAQLGARTKVITKIGDVKCTFRGKQNASCDYTVTVVDSTKIPSLSSGRGKIYKQILTTGMPDERTHEFSSRFRHNGKRWQAQLKDSHFVLLDGSSGIGGEIDWDTLRDRRDNERKEITRTALLGKLDAPNELVVYFSVGCPGCITQLDALMPMLEARIKAGSIRLDLVEISGRVHSHSDTKERKRAINNALRVSRVLDCIAQTRPEDTLSTLKQLIKLAKSTLPANNWSNWAYATMADLKNPPQVMMKAKTVGDGFSLALHVMASVDREACKNNKVTDMWKSRLNARFARFHETKRNETVPRFYWNGGSADYALLKIILSR